jgi:hypothetical protein
MPSPQELTKDGLEASAKASAKIAGRWFDCQMTRYFFVKSA